MSYRILLGLILAAALGTSAACSPRDSTLGGASPIASVSPSATAPTTPGASPAGDAQPLPASLQKVLDGVATVRKLSAPPSLKAEAVRRSDLPALLDRLLTDDDRRWFAQTTTLYRLLGHMRNDQDYLSIYKSFGSDSVLGLYSPVEDQLWVVLENGDPAGLDKLSRDQTQTLAHEFVHALQDYHFSLDTAYEKTVDDLDLNLAWTAVVEGDAVTHEALYAKTVSLRPGGGGPLLLLAGQAQANDVPASIQRELYFPYTAGADWVRGIVNRQGVDVVNRYLVDPPRGTVFVLHPELLDQGWQPATVTLPDLSGALGSGWKRESGGTLGEFGLKNYLQLKLGASQAAVGAAGWAGDHYDVYVNGTASVAVVRVKFASAAEAGEFTDRQLNLLEAAGAQPGPESAMRVFTAADGDVTVIPGSTSDEVLFAIGTTKAAAWAAMLALLGS
ncbi:MAG: hypothetical protein HY875_16225 [Chloroflexi bacterium]|nr:hypothetical protein [Chloroflexota bacterium]